MKKLAFVALAICVTLFSFLGNASAVPSSWTNENILLSKMAGPTKAGEAKQVGNRLVIPFTFVVGNITFVATKELSNGNESTTYLTPNGINAVHVPWHPVEVFLAVAPSGKTFSVWSEIHRDSSDRLIASLVSHEFGTIVQRELDSDSCYGSYSCQISLGFSGISLVAIDDSHVALSYVLKSNACSVSAKLVYVSDPESPLVTDRTLAETPASCDVYESPGLGYGQQLVVSDSGKVFAFWRDYQNQTPRMTFWSAGDWAEPVGIQSLDPSQQLVAVNRSSDYLTLVSLVDSGKVQVVDVRASTGEVSLPKFEFTLNSTRGNFFAFADRDNDGIQFYYANDGYRLDSQNQLSNFLTMDDAIENVYQAPSGRVVIETRGPQVSQYASYSRNLWVRETGKMIKYLVPDIYDDATPFSFHPNGDLVAIYYLGSGGSEDNYYADGLGFRSLTLSGVPRLENTGKPLGVAKVGQTIRVASPQWITYSKLSGQTSVSWLSCTKAVSKPATSVPAGCKLIRNASGPSYTLSAGDKGKFITAQLSATNLTGTGTSVLPSLGPVK